MPHRTSPSPPAADAYEARVVEHHELTARLSDLALAMYLERRARLRCPHLPYTPTQPQPARLVAA